MRQAIQLVTITAALVLVSSVSVLGVEGACIVAVSRSLHHTGFRWNDARGLQAPTNPRGLARAVAAPLQQSSTSDFIGEIQRVAFATAAEVPNELSGISHDANATRSSSFRPLLSTVQIVPVPVRRPAEIDIERITFDTPRLAPLGFVRFCMSYPQDCVTPRKSAQSQLVSLTAVRRLELETVNRDVNRSIKPSQKVNAAADDWQVSPHEGKCTDYAITKRHELLARRWPGNSLLLAEVVIPSGEHHLVLVVRTRENDLVLDNLNESIRPISEIPYQWVRVQQTNNPRFWATVNASRAIRIAANAGSVRPSQPQPVATAVR